MAEDEKGTGGPGANGEPNRGRRARTREEMTELAIRTWEFKRSGTSFRQVARLLGVSVSTAYGYYEKARAIITKEMVTSGKPAIVLQLSRLDALMAPLWARAVGYSRPVLDKDGNPTGRTEQVPPDLDASRQVLAIIERQCRIQGTDMPRELIIRARREGGETEDMGPPTMLWDFNPDTVFPDATPPGTTIEVRALDAPTTNGAGASAPAIPAATSPACEPEPSERGEKGEDDDERL